MIVVQEIKQRRELFFACAGGDQVSFDYHNGLAKLAFNLRYSCKQLKCNTFQTKHLHYLQTTEITQISLTLLNIDVAYELWSNL